jgi:hypothetical protein
MEGSATARAEVRERRLPSGLLKLVRVLPLVTVLIVLFSALFIGEDLVGFIDR